MRADGTSLQFNRGALRASPIPRVGGWEKKSSTAVASDVVEGDQFHYLQLLVTGRLAKCVVLGSILE